MATSRIEPPPVNAPKPKAKTPTAIQGTHNIWVGLIGELIGVAALAVFADLNENVGRLAVVMMVGWFILFLSINAQWLSGVVPGASAGQSAATGSANSLVNAVQSKLG